MRQEVALETDGTPVVRPFRSDEGQLVFRYLVVRPGGMAVWLEVPQEGLRQGSVPGLDRRLKAAARELARSIAAGEIESRESTEALQGQVAALGEELEGARARVAELEAERENRVERAEQREPPGPGRIGPPAGEPPRGRPRQRRTAAA